ncbi:substrate-binding domain-containing protein [Rhizobium sp. BK251]|uniref:substrate-binding domain-containing protein n=1 Tax=Rhizobium sp. BK251 TaxID=2512125 RepID=UPI001044D014|nr:substrate-binding domain-containing protein [Rhizobium sp. BK251]TCL64102.1 D-xylose transport system substrate-binding protein [Rhizobium sp. BK251]
MLKLSHMLAGAVAGVALMTGVAAAQDTVGVSWRYFQDERWKIDEAAMKSVFDKAGVSYVGIDAQGDPQKQAADIESLIARGVKVLVVVAQDAKAIIPVIDEAKRSNIAVIAYDAPIDTGDLLYTSFDNVAVGRVMGEALLKAVPKGNWVAMDGDPAQTIQQVFKSGQMQAIQAAVDKGDIKIVAQQNVEQWKPDVAQALMEQVLTANDNKVDAVLAMNDSIANGVAAALSSQDLLGKVGISGQDGDKNVLNRIAKGDQTMTVWKDANALGQTAAKAAVEIIKGAKIDAVTGAKAGKTDSGASQPAIILDPVAITRDNLDLVVQSGWISKDVLCNGVTKNPPKACE